MNNTTTRLFVGDPVEEPSEKALISRLRSDLDSRGVRATLFANFFASPRGSCQVDLLVRTESRTAHVEIKGLHPDYPVLARVNGPWEQRLPDGTERSLGKNAGWQALQGTFAISDTMRDLASERGWAEPEGGFKVCIDSLVGMWEVIPQGSAIRTPKFVEVVGYDDLLQRLTQPGPMVPWGDAEWDAFALRLNLYQPEPESEPERRRRVGLEILTDYRLRAVSSLGEGLSTFVDVGTADGGADVSAPELSRRVTGGAVVALVGTSGGGKSFLAQHLAVTHCNEGRLVMWLKAGDYPGGQFKDLLARAMGPFSAEPWRTLADAARETGTPVTIVVDGLDGCPNPERTKMIRQLTAFTLRHPASVLITSTTEDAISSTLDAVIYRVREPNERTRLEILTAHGAKQPERISDQFRTPYELSIAAECESELDEHASITDLHDAYIRWFVPREQQRAALRSLARPLHSMLRTSLPRRDVASVLDSPTLELTQREVDEVLACDLLAIESHRVRFRHDLIGQFLAAEDLVRSAASGQSLGVSLTSVVNTDLTDTALRIESDQGRVWEALRVLADPEFIASALANSYGPEVAETAAREIRDVLHRGVASTAAKTTQFKRSDGWSGRWVTERGWTEYERSLLAAAGLGLTKGLFVDEVCELIDRTDEVCAAQAQRLSAEGDQVPVSRIFSCTYAQSAGSPDGFGLAASYVVGAFQLVTMGRIVDPDSRSPGLASRFVTSASDRSWGRFFLALLALFPDNAPDQALFSSLLQRAWNAGGYHLQLEALHVARFFGRSNEPLRSEILGFVRDLDPWHPFLADSRVEVLFSFGEIENRTTVEQLQATIRAIISHPDDIECCKLAASIVCNQFEDENIFGPYFTAIDELICEEKARLFVMAARGAEPFVLGMTLRQLAELVPTGDSDIDNDVKSIFADFLRAGPIEDTSILNEAAAPCLASVRGWCKFEAGLPQESLDSTPLQRNWYLIAGLLVGYERNDSIVDPEETWRTLLREPQQTIVTLAYLDYATRPSGDPALKNLVADYAEPLRRLFEWALDNPIELPMDRLLRHWDVTDLFVVRMLGAVGDESTAARLQVYINDPEMGSATVEAIRKIHSRSLP